MSNRINLLPWREEERKRKNIEFGIMAGAGILFVVLVVSGVLMYIEDRISYQSQRNNFIKNEISVLNSKLETIKELEAKKRDLLERMNVIQELQGSRPESVHLLEELVKAIPEGIWLSNVSQSSSIVEVDGITESNARVSAFMRNIEESEWMAPPQLVSILKNAKQQKSDGEVGAEFKLKFKQESPIREDQ